MIDCPYTYRDVGGWNSALDSTLDPHHSLVVIESLTTLGSNWSWTGLRLTLTLS